MNNLRAWAAVLAATALVVTACGTSDESAAPVDQPCEVAAGSAEAKLLHGLLGTDQVETTYFETTPDLVERLREDLREQVPGKPTSTADACRFKPKDGTGSSSARLEFFWLPKDDTGRRLPAPSSRYDVNGVEAEANDITSALRVSCVLPAAEAKPSSQVYLRADLTNTVLMGTKVSEETKKQQVSFAYLLAREVTEALGCKGDPLKKDPVVRTERAGS
ncbi:hypothetical protein [Streptomyces roseoviridis]|uniref:DUF3558 domain-containing protein n=1 Tax=Streptomyces roseoviridis TaxID=67361 RepID=A0ABV5QVX8_9ACTN